MPSPPAEAALVAVREAALSVDEVLDAVRHPRCGGVALFVGVVRDHDHGDRVTSLDYSAHPSAAGHDGAGVPRRARPRRGPAGRRGAPGGSAARSATSPSSWRRRRPTGGRRSPRPATSSTPSRRRPPSGSTSTSVTAPRSGWGCREAAARRPGRAEGPGGARRRPCAAARPVRRRPADRGVRPRDHRGRPHLRAAAVRHPRPGPGHERPRHRRRHPGPHHRRGRPRTRPRARWTSRPSCSTAAPGARSPSTRCSAAGSRPTSTSSPRSCTSRRTSPRSRSRPRTPR